VSVDILHDGVGTLKVAVADLIDRKPERTDQKGAERLPGKVREHLEALDWVEKADVRMREEGHIFVGEAFVIPKAGTRDLIAKIERAVAEAKAIDWRMHDLVVQPVADLPPYKP
ncbi:MAG TPA: hypothetical protein VF589_06775, partial [Allosphingosinicella sp.]